MAAALLYLPANRAFNSNGLGVPGAVAKLYTTGTLTPQNFYSNSALSVSLGSSITANAAGRFAPAYQDETVPFRLRVEDSLGVELDDIDPYYFGSLYGSVISTAGTVAASRTALAQLSGVAGATVYLAESRRRRSFTFYTAAAFLTEFGIALTTVVTADATTQGFVVAPATDTTGASGAWVAEFNGQLNICHFGAVANCTAVGTGTDNAAAINAAKAVALLLGKGTEILIPKATLGYRVSSAITFTSGVKLRGQGFHENPGNVGGTTYSVPQNYRGSVLVFDINIAGLKFIDYTDNAANATAFEFESSRFSVVEDLMLYGGGGTTVTAHGIETRTVVGFRNVRIDAFAGNGLHIIGYTSAVANPYGNTDGSKFDHVKCRSNGCHGIYAEGNDANIMTFIACDTSLNGGVGVLDKSIVGVNGYYSHHSATNNQSYGATSNQRTQVTADWAGLSDQNAGSYVTSNGGSAESQFFGCYTETGVGSKAEITSPAIVIGGTLADTGVRTASWTATVYSGAAGGYLYTQSLASGTTGVIAVNSNVAIAQTNALCSISLTPGSSTYSEIQLKGNSSLLANGLDILAGGAASYFSSDGFTFRNAAQSSTWLSADSSGVNVQTVAFKVGGTTVVDTSRNITGVAGTFSGALTSSSATAGIGYATGAGGTVTQITSRTTGVTLNKVCGNIVLFSAAGQTGWQSFTVTNSTIAAGDVIKVVQKSGTDKNLIHVTAVAAGSFEITFATTGGTTTEQPVFNFARGNAVAA